MSKPYRSFTPRGWTNNNSLVSFRGAQDEIDDMAAEKRASGHKPGPEEQRALSDELRKLSAHNTDPVLNASERFVSEAVAAKSVKYVLDGFSLLQRRLSGDNEQLQRAYAVVLRNVKDTRMPEGNATMATMVSTIVWLAASNIEDHKTALELLRDIGSVQSLPAKVRETVDQCTDMHSVRK